MFLEFVQLFTKLLLGCKKKKTALFYEGVYITARTQVATQYYCTYHRIGLLSCKVCH